MARTTSRHAWPVLIALALTATASAEPAARPSAATARPKNIFEPKKMATLAVVGEMDSCMKAIASASGTSWQKLKHCGCFTDWLRGSRKEPTAEDVYQISRGCGAWSQDAAKEKGISRSPFYNPSIGFESERVLSAHLGCIKGGKKTDPTATLEYSTAFCGCLGDAVRFRKGSPEKPFANFKPGDQDACEAHARKVAGRK